VDSGIAAIIAAAVGAAVLLITHGGSDGAGSTVAACNGTTITGSSNRINCSPTIKQRSPQEQTRLKGQSIPVTCNPEGESAVLQTAATVEVHVWCSELMPVRKLVQTKLKVWASNRTKRPRDVSLRRWYLLVPGDDAAHYWSPPPGRQWPRPMVVDLPDGKVTAIPANPDGEAEDLGAISGGRNLSFATHWKKRYLAPGETWHPPRRDRRTGNRYLDGTLVFYVPLVRRRGKFYQPIIYGLARMRGRKVLTLCPKGRWGRRVSSEKF
jgi:hypothetical protein